MDQNELERVKADLEVMTTAAGMERTYTCKEVYISLFGGIIFLLISGIDVVFGGLSGGLSLVIIFVVMFCLLVAANMGKQEVTPSRRPPRSYQWLLFITSFLFLMGYTLWKEKFNFPHYMDLGIGLMFWGAVSVIESYWRTRRFYEAIQLVPLIISGALFPLYPSHLLAVCGIPFAAGAFAYAGVIVFVIRRHKVINDAD
jgi:hypothetical protein